MMTPVLPVMLQTEVIAPMPPLPPWAMMDPAALTLVASIFLAVVFMLALPLVRALSRRIEGKRAALDPSLAGELDELRARVAELEQRQGALHELEERMDFTERLLAQQREQARLPH
jgi:Tfp pilus assembly protein PilO